MKPLHLMLFDLYAGGHNGQYVEYLLRHWVERGYEGRVDVVVPHHFVGKYPTLAAFVAEHRDAGIEVVPMDPSLDAEAIGGRSLLQLDRLHGRLLRRHVAARQPDHCLLMSMDHAQLSLALGLRFDLPVALSGIYFRPSFHYGGLGGPEVTFADRLKALRKVVLLRAALRNPHLRFLFSLDPYAVPHVRRMAGAVDVVALPDGAALSDAGASPADVRRRWGVAADRHVALMFGALSERKGLFQVLDAALQLPPRDQRRLCLVLAGRLGRAERDRAEAAFDRLRRTTAVQLVVDDRFVDDDEIQGMVRAADLVLVTYQRHVGSSNVLIRAAAVPRPVLGSDYGLVGAHIRKHRLGLSVDTTQSGTVAAALRRFLDDPDGIPFDAEAAVTFAHANDARHYAETILRRVAGEVGA